MNYSNGSVFEIDVEENNKLKKKRFKIVNISGRSRDRTSAFVPVGSVGVISIKGKKPYLFRKSTLKMARFI